MPVSKDCICHEHRPVCDCVPTRVGLFDDENPDVKRNAYLLIMGTVLFMVIVGMLA